MTVKNNRFAVRDETFGYTLYDKEKMRHKFVANLDDLAFSDVKVDEYEHWVGDLTDAPEDIIFSPIRVYFELTSECNLRCKTCFNSSGKTQEGELTTEEVKLSLDGLRANNVFDIRYSGGELTARPDWQEIMTHSKNIGLSTSINTNGVYQNHDEIIDKLTSLDLDQVTISIDGGRNFHDYIRGKGNFDKAVKTMEDLYNKGNHVRINTVLTKGSSDDLEEILELAGKYCEEINFFYMRITGRANNLLNYVLDYDGLVDFDNKIEPMKEKYPHVRILHGSKVMAINSVDKNKKDDFGLKMGGPDGFTRFNILPTGNIFPGGYTPHLKPEYLLGNIKDEGYDILNIWRNSNKLHEFREKSLSLQEACSGCPDKNIKCLGASMEMNFYKEKYGTNPYCGQNEQIKIKK